MVATHNVGKANAAAAQARLQERMATEQRGTAERATEESQRQQEKLAREAAEDARRQREETALQQRITINRRLIGRARAMIGDDPKKALMLGVAAQRLHSDAQTADQLSHLAMATPFAGAIGDAIDVAAVPGQAVATAGAGGTVSLWNPANPAKPVRLAPLPTDGTADKSPCRPSRSARTGAPWQPGVRSAPRTRTSGSPPTNGPATSPSCRTGPPVDPGCRAAGGERRT